MTFAKWWKPFKAANVNVLGEFRIGGEAIARAAWDAAVREEREACVRICEARANVSTRVKMPFERIDEAKQIAAEIRARGEHSG